MRILMIAPGYSPHSSRPVEWLVNRGVEVVFYDRVNPFPNGMAGYEFHFSSQLRGKSYIKKISNQLGCYLERQIEINPIVDLFHRRKCDLVHVSNVNISAAFCAEALLHPLVLTVWGSDINALFLKDSHSEYRARIGNALSSADLILADSEDMEEKCSKLAGQKINTHLHFLGVNTQLFKPGYTNEALSWRRGLNISVDAKVFLSIRGLRPHYGQNHIISAFAKARAYLPAQTVLVINTLSSDHEFEAKLRKMTCDLGVEQDIRWMPPVPMSQLPFVYAGVDVIVNYPFRDAFPVSFIEAAACKKQVISSRLPAYNGTFAEKYFTFVLPEDYQSLSKALVSSLKAEKYNHSQILNAAREFVSLNFDESICAEHLILYYKELLSARKCV